MSGNNSLDNKTRTKSALVSLSEEIETVAHKVSKSVVSVVQGLEEMAQELFGSQMAS